MKLLLSLSLSVFTSCGEQGSLRVCGFEERWSHLLHECGVSAALHAAWSRRGAQDLCDNYSLQVPGCINISKCRLISGFPLHWGWHWPARRKCLLPGPVSVWSPDGEQVAVLRTWELLEGNLMLEIVRKKTWSCLKLWGNLMPVIWLQMLCVADF